MSWIAELKEKINIVDFIRADGIQLKPDGVGRYSAKCPFHIEKTPSFKVSEDYQNFQCFGCKKGGDVIAYFAEKSILSYMEAAIALAEKYGIKVKEYNNSGFVKTKELYSLLSDLEEYFKASFNELPLTHPAKQQILNRKLKITSDFGYAPKNPNETISYLKNKGHSLENMKDIGLINDNGNLIFIDRLMFFIRNYMGQTIGFSGRSLANEINGWKYINSAQSIIFNKQLALYNIDEAKTSARKKQYIYLVEGQFDVIAMKQNGFTNTVAVSGSAITERQIKELEKAIGDEGKIILLMDGDEAGKSAMEKTIEKYPEIHKKLYIIELPDNMDPCDYLQMKKPLPKANNIIQTVFDNIRKSFDFNEPQYRIQFLENIQNRLTKFITDKSLKEQYLRNACGIAGISYESITEKTVKQKQSKNEIEEKINPFKNKYDEYFLNSLGIYFSNRQYFPTLDKTKYPPYFQTFLSEITSYTLPHFVPEKFTNVKLAKLLQDMDCEKFDDQFEAISQYDGILNYATRYYNQKQRNDKIYTQIKNLEHNEQISI